MSLYIVLQKIPSITYDGMLYTSAIAVYNSEEQAKEVVYELNEHYKPSNTGIFFVCYKLKSEMNTCILYDFLVEHDCIHPRRRFHESKETESETR